MLLLANAVISYPYTKDSIVSPAGACYALAVCGANDGIFDWRIDLGPGGGPDGGRLLHCGPPVAERPIRVTPRAKRIRCVMDGPSHRAKR